MEDFNINFRGLYFSKLLLKFLLKKWMLYVEIEFHRIFFKKSVASWQIGFSAPGR